MKMLDSVIVGCNTLWSHGRSQGKDKRSKVQSKLCLCYRSFWHGTSYFRTQFENDPVSWLYAPAHFSFQLLPRQTVIFLLNILHNYFVTNNKFAKKSQKNFRRHRYTTRTVDYIIAVYGRSKFYF